MLVKCVVACRDASGCPTFFPCSVSVSQDDYDDGAHYDIAKNEAGDYGYEFGLAAIVYDENDGPEWLFEQFDWEKAATIDYSEDDEDAK